MNRGIFFILVFLFTYQSFGFTEIFAVHELKMRVENPQNYLCPESQERFWKLEKVETSLDSSKAFSKDNTYQLRYSQFGCELGSNGSIVMVPGRTEGSLDYYEMAEEYYNRGYSPIFVMDPRGQGFSPRLLKNSHKGHVRLFDDYTFDLYDLMAKAVLPKLKNLGWKNGDPLFLTSNSMGGGIAIRYFQVVGQDNPFTAGAFIASMIKINYASFIPAPQTPELYNQFSEQNVNILTAPRCSNLDSPECQDYPVELLAGRPTGDYIPGSRKFKKDTELMMTNSPYRYSIREMLWESLDSFFWKKFKAENFESDENWENLQLGAATNGWAYQSTIINPLLRDPKNIEKMSAKVPIVLVSGTRDLRIYRVFYDEKGNVTTDLKPHFDFCASMNKVHGQTNLCQVKPVVGGFHELYKETDRDGKKYREKTFKITTGFFESHGSK